MTSLHRWLGHNKKAPPMMLICFLICFIHCLIRNMKDSLVITAEGGNAEAIPFIQFWMMLPATLVAAAIFTRLSDKVSQKALFQLVILAFLTFFVVFGSVLYPLRDSLHPVEVTRYLSAILPEGFNGMIAMVHNWVFSLFFTAAELWSCFVTSVLFWSFANQITELESAPSSYGLYAMSGNLGAMTSGIVPRFTHFISGEYAVYILLGLILVAGVCIIGIFRWMNHNILMEDKYSEIRKPKASKKSMGLKEALGLVIRSPYLSCLALIVFSYYFLLNLGELVWKDRLKQVYTTFHEYNAYLGYTTIATGALSCLLAGIFPKILKRFGWTASSLTCPTIILVIGTLFLGSLYLTDVAPVPQYIMLNLAIIFGTLLEVGGRATKNSIFDASKEIAYIPLPSVIKLKGKAAVDGVFSRIGRSASASSHQVMIISLASIANSVGVILALLVIGAGAWMWATLSLGKQFDALTQEKNTTAAELNSAVA